MRRALSTVVSGKAWLERYRRLGLRGKFALHIAGSIVLLFGLIIPIVVYVQTEAAVEQARHRGLELTKVFAHASVQSLVADDFLAMRHIVNSIASDPAVLYVMIQDRGGRLLVHSDMRQVGAVLTDGASAAAARAERPLVQPIAGSNGVAEDFTVPVYVMNDSPAVARIGISFADELARIHRTRTVVLAVGLLALAAGVLLGRLQARSVARPVAQLVEGADAVSHGRLDHRIPSSGGGELGQLAAAFNRMAGSVQALIETSRDLSSSLDVDAVLRSIARHARELARADVVAIAPVDEETGAALVRVVLGARTPRFAQLAIPPGRGLGGRVLETGKPLLTGNYPSDDRFAHDPALDRFMGEEGVVSLLAVPIASPRGTLGLIWAGSPRPDAFTAEDLDTLGQMARQAAIALDNARLYERLKQSHEALSAAQDELVRQARLAAIGQIAAAVAHEVRNPLSALSTCVQLLRASPELTGEDAELFQIIQTEARRLNDIVSDFLAFGRPRPPRLETVSLPETIQETLGLLRRDPRCAAAIAFDLAFDPTVPTVSADRDQLHQAIWNLCLNACQAMGGEGKLRVATELRADRAAVHIEDTGPGIAAASRARVFDPFYTTKAGGVGLGLAIVRRIMEDHGGDVLVDVARERGTCFTLTLPLAHSPTAPAAS